MRSAYSCIAWSFLLYGQFCLIYLQYHYAVVKPSRLVWLASSYTDSPSDANQTQLSSTDAPKQSETTKALSNVETTEAPKVTANEAKAETNPEWIQLNNITFFSRQGAYFLVNHMLLKLFVLVNSNNKTNYDFDVNLFVDFNNRTYNFTFVRRTHYYRMGIFHRSYYDYVTIETRFDIESIMFTEYKVKISSPIKDQVKLRIGIFDKVNNITMRELLDVKIKQWKKREKDGSMICAGIHYGYGEANAKDNLERFKWWLEANKLFGHAKISIINNSIPNTKEYADLFEKYKDLVEISQLKYIPNFVIPPFTSTHTHHDYLGSFTALEGYYKSVYNTFKLMFYNECLLDNIDKYEYVFIYDTDELLIPRVMPSKFVSDAEIGKLVSSLDLNKTNDRETMNKQLASDVTCHAPSPSSPQKTHVQSYMEYLKSMNKKTGSYYFQMDLHLGDESIRKIIESFDDYFGSNQFLEKQNKADYNHLITVKNESSYYGNFNYCIKFENKQDLIYGRNLIKIYKLLVDSFKKKNLSITENSKYNLFDRFLYMNGDLTKNQDGKSVHNTDVALEVNIHMPTRLYGTVLNVDPNYGHMSHFRLETNIRPSIPDTPLVMNVRDLKFNFNYFYCYYSKLLKSIASVDLF